MSEQLQAHYHSSLHASSDHLQNPLSVYSCRLTPFHHCIVALNSSHRHGVFIALIVTCHSEAERLHGATLIASSSRAGSSLMNGSFMILLKQAENYISQWHKRAPAYASNFDSGRCRILLHQGNCIDSNLPAHTPRFTSQPIVHSTIICTPVAT